MVFGLLQRAMYDCGWSYSILRLLLYHSRNNANLEPVNP
jgi:hypothetical protein